MVGFFNCGYAHVAARNSVYDENKKVIYDKSTCRQRFLGTFYENKEAFAVSQITFDKRLPVLLQNFKKWCGESKSKYLDHFSSTEWKSLSALKRGLHSISNCRECHVNHLLFQTHFPLKSNRLKGADPVATCTKESGNLRKTTKAVKPSKKAIQDTAKSIYLKINEPFKNPYNINLADAFTKVPETGLTRAKTKVQKQRERRESARRFKNSAAEQWSKLDCDTMLGTRQSFKQRDLQENLFIFSPMERLKFRQARGKHSRRRAFERKSITLQIPAPLTLTKLVYYRK